MTTRTCRSAKGFRLPPSEMSSTGTEAPGTSVLRALPAHSKPPTKSQCDPPRECEVDPMWPLSAGALGPSASNEPSYWAELAM